MINRIILCLSCMVLSMQLMAQSNDLPSRFLQINQAFKKQDIKIVQPLLDSNFTVGTYAGNDAFFVLNAIMSRYQLDSFQIKEVKENASLVIVDADIAGGKDSSTKFYFSKDYKLIRADLFDKLYGLDRDKPAVKVATIPFEFENGFIYLTITLNDNQKKLKFLFDTGSDGMMVNTSLADELGLDISREQQASAVGGHIDIKVSENNMVHFGGFDLDHQGIAIFGSTNPDHDGIIGNTIFKKYITHIDYDKKEMILYSLGKFISEKKEKTLPVDVKTGNVLLGASVCIKEGNPVPGEFTFDTGAGYSMIVFRPTVLKYKMLVSGFVQDSSGTTVSMGMVTPVFHGKAQNVSFNTMGKEWEIPHFPISLMGSSQSTANWKPGAAGSIGVRFISRYNFTVNLVDKYILFEERKKN